MNRYFTFAGRTWTLAVTFLATLAFLFAVFPALAIGGTMLDVMPGYSHTEAMAAMEGYGASGRSVYATASLTLDTLFPLVYVTLFSGLIHRFRWSDRTAFLAWIPVVAGIVDLGENVQIVAMLFSYPNVGEAQVAVASAFTTVKGWLGPVYQLLAVALLAVAGIRKLRKRLRLAKTG